MSLFHPIYSTPDHALFQAILQTKLKFGELSLPVLFSFPCEPFFELVGCVFSGVWGGGV
jgi:hypothetical protein